jgi:hypothetical protein
MVLEDRILYYILEREVHFLGIVNWLSNIQHIIKIFNRSKALVGSGGLLWF